MITCFRVFLVLATSLTTGCSPIVNYMPPVPMRPGTTAVTLQGIWAMGRSIRQSLQLSVQTAVGDKGVLGIGFYSVLPGSISYARYYDIGGGYLNWQVHLNDGFFQSLSYSPILEADIAYGAEHGDFSHSARFGVALMGPMLFEVDRIEVPPNLGPRPFGILMTMGYGVQWGRLDADAGLVPLSTRYFARQVRELPRSDNDTTIILRRDEIISIDSTGFRNWASWSFDTVWVIHPKQGRSLGIFGSRYGSGNPRWGTERQDQYAASPGHRTYHLAVLQEPDSTQPISPYWHPTYYVMELDLRAILSEYKRTGILRIAEEPDLNARAIERVGFGWEDATFGIGYMLQTE